MPPKKQHHHTPRSYLANFAIGDRKLGRIQVLDIESKTWHSSNPIDAGKKSRFYRIDAPQTNPDVIEDYLEKVEASAAPVMQMMLETRELPRGQDRAELLNFISHQYLRGPHIRAVMDEHMVRMGKMMAQLNGANISPEAFQEIKESILQQDTLPEGTSREDFEKMTHKEFREFAISDRYTVSTSKNYLVLSALQYAYEIYPYLWDRKWELLVAPRNAEFISSDNPVTIISSIPGYKWPVGFALRNTEVYFPLSAEIALMGTFEGEEATREVHELIVAGMNQVTFLYANRFVYAKSQNFGVLSSPEGLSNWETLADRFIERKRKNIT